MKKCLLLLSFALITTIASAQLKVGPGLTLTPDIGITGKIQKDITDKIDGSVNLTYFFGNTVEAFGVKSTTSTILVEVNGQYNLDVSDNFIVYPLAGLGLIITSAKTTGAGAGFDGSSSASDIVLNLGGGINYPLSSFDLFAEAKILIGGASNFYLQAGALFPLGGAN